MNEKYDERGRGPIAIRRNRATTPRNSSLSGVLTQGERLVEGNQLHTSSGDDSTAISAVLTRHIAYLEAELREARSKFEAVEVERNNERARAAQLAIKLAQVDAVNAILLQAQSRRDTSRRAQRQPVNHHLPKPVTPCAVAPDGTLLTMTNLPGPETKRWVPSRKAIVVAAVRVGMLSMEEACARYKLTEEEYTMWQFQVERHGLAGLRTSKGQLYRRS
jgi:hypothetical protein